MAYERATGLTWVPFPVAECTFIQTPGLPEAFRKAAIEKGHTVPRNLRLPTLEEAANLMMPVQSSEGYYRHPYLKGAPHMLTCDTHAAPFFVKGTSGFVWVADLPRRISTQYHGTIWLGPFGW